MVDYDGVDLEIEMSPEPRRWRGRLVALVGLFVFVVLGAIAVNAAGGDGEGAVPDSADDTEAVGDTDAVDAAGRYDGLDSVRLPLEVTPDSDLVDGMEIVARGTGYTPHATVAVIQCAALPSGAGGDGTGSIANCDLSNYVLGSADDQGFVDMRLTVRRYIANEGGEIDCALSDVACSVAIGNIANYDESGVANVWFDGNVEGVHSPVISVSPTVGIHDGDPLTVTGANFEPGDTIRLSQCVIGGSHSFAGCFSSSFVTDTVIAADDGTFSATVTARRLLESGIDCFDDVYGCRLAAHGTTDAPNPVGLFFDGSVRPSTGVSLTLDPGFDLFDGVFVTVSVDQVPVDGEIELRQCVDQGSSAGVTCGPVVTTAVVDGSATTTYVIEQFLTNADGEVVDCAEPHRVCEFRVSGAHEQTVPLRFVGQS